MNGFDVRHVLTEHFGVRVQKGEDLPLLVVAVPRRCLFLLSKGKDSLEQKDEEFSLAGVYTNKNEIWFASAYSSVYGLCVQVPANVMIHNRRQERTDFPANYVYLYPFRVEKVARGSRPHTAAGWVSSPCVVNEKWLCWRLDTFLLLFCVLTAVRSYQYHIRRSRCVLIFSLNTRNIHNPRTGYLFVLRVLRTADNNSSSSCTTAGGGGFGKNHTRSSTDRL